MLSATKASPIISGVASIIQAEAAATMAGGKVRAHFSRVDAEESKAKQREQGVGKTGLTARRAVALRCR